MKLDTHYCTDYMHTQIDTVYGTVLANTHYTQKSAASAHGLQANILALHMQ